MSSVLHRPALSWLIGMAVVLAAAYVGLMAVTLSYAALQIAFTQSVRNDEAAVASLESQYLTAVGDITAAPYGSFGYAKPTIQIFVTAPQTALTMR